MTQLPGPSVPPASALEFESSRGMGSDHVRFLTGGIMTWSDDGLPQVTP